MFNHGIDELFDALPALEELPPAEVRRLLTAAWLDAVDQRDLSGPAANPSDNSGLRRLASALAVRLLLIGGLGPEERRGCAFVAAECLGIARELSLGTAEPEPWAFGSMARFETVEESLLYLIAGFDANASLTARALDDLEIVNVDDELPIAEWTLRRIFVLLDLQLPVPLDAPPARAGVSVRNHVRHELWRRVGAGIAEHVRWLKMQREDDPNTQETLLDLVRQLELQPDGSLGVATHPDVHQLCILLAAACEETSGRAIRRLTPPDGDGGRFAAYQRHRARRMPLLWPAAAEYATEALPGPHSHAVVSVPTGAGKSAVAELGIAQAVSDGWVLYLAPTNALVAQVRRDLTRSMASLDGVQVRGFLGGAEYTELEGETIAIIPDSNVLVMTPEKCSLALRRNPDAFERLSFCILDEAHLLGEDGTRGVITELVVAEVLHRSPNARVLMLSALIRNADDLRTWLEDATGRAAVKVDRAWRPTRTLRALAGLNAESAELLRATARDYLEVHPDRSTKKVDVPIRLLAGLQGAWAGEAPADYAIVDTGLTTKAAVRPNGRFMTTNHTAPTTRVLVQTLAEKQHRVLTFLPDSRHAPFSHAKALVGLPNRKVDISRADIDALLVLADAEIGGTAEAGARLSAVHDALEKGVAVHTSAMLQYEQRACELAFEKGVAAVMFATGTLAQGLNLPATAVVVGGTAVGDRRLRNTPKGRARARAQLLNAIGRAGRAQIAARSISIVVPNEPIQIAAQPAVATARREAPFLAEEDAAVDIHSQLAELIDRSLAGTLDMETMTLPEQTAFAFLSYTGEAGDAEAVLRHTYGVDRAGARERADVIAETLQTIGASFLTATDAPAWIATAAHRAGVALPVALELERIARARLEDVAAPDTVSAWAMWLIETLELFDKGTLRAALGKDPWKSTAIDGIHDGKRDCWEAFARVAESWLDGQPLTAVGAALHGQTDPIVVGRSSRDPLPRLLRVIRHGIEFELSAIAGALLAVVVTGQEEESNTGDGVWTLEPSAQRALSLLPLAIRLGAAKPEALALMRAGVRPRVLAHLISSRIQAPESEDDEVLRTWAFSVVAGLEDPAFLDSLTETATERELLAAAAFVAAEL